MVRAKSELIEVALHVLGADRHMRRADRSLEQPPEAFHAVDVVLRLVAVIEVAPLLLAVRDGAVLEAVAGE